MIVAIGTSHDLKLVDVPSVEFAAHEMSKNPGQRARVFDMHHGRGVLVHDVAVCAESYRYNMNTLTQGALKA